MVVWMRGVGMIVMLQSLADFVQVVGTCSVLFLWLIYLSIPFNRILIFRFRKRMCVRRIGRK